MKFSAFVQSSDCDHGMSDGRLCLADLHNNSSPEVCVEVGGQTWSRVASEVVQSSFLKSIARDDVYGAADFKTRGSVVDCFSGWWQYISIAFDAFNQSMWSPLIVILSIGYIYDQCSYTSHTQALPHRT